MSAALIAAALGDVRRGSSLPIGDGWTSPRVTHRRSRLHGFGGSATAPTPPHRPNFRGGTSLIDNRAIGVALGGQVKRLVVARAAKRVREALPNVSMVEAIGAG
jgi:hypothetical protein